MSLFTTLSSQSCHKSEKFSPSYKKNLRVLVWSISSLLFLSSESKPNMCFPWQRSFRALQMQSIMETVFTSFHTSPPQRSSYLTFFFFFSEAHKLSAREHTRQLGRCSTVTRQGRNVTGSRTTLTSCWALGNWACRTIYFPESNYVLTSGWCDSKWVGGTRWG